MITLTRTVDVGELLWIAAALPGLWLWLMNLRDARKDFRAVRDISPRNGRYLWAKFSTLLTRAFLGLELLFIGLGVQALFRTPPAAPASLSRVITVIGLIAASVVISAIAYRWKRVNAEIVQAARDKHLALDRELPPRTRRPTRD